MSLAPLYDLVSTVAYPDVSPKLAMKIAKRATLEEIGPATWPAFAEDAGLAAPFVRRRVTELAEAVSAQAPSIRESPTLAGLDVDALETYSSLIVSRAERVARTGVTPSSSAQAGGQIAPDEPTTKSTSRKRKGGAR